MTSNVCARLMVLTCLSAVNADALEFEYQVVGGHAIVSSAFRTLALIFSDHGYQTLFLVTIATGLAFGGLMLAGRIISGSPASPMAWLTPALSGILLYLALVIPKGTLHIYDPVFNKTEAVSGIPDGLVVMAGMLNLLERGLVAVVTNAGDPLGYTMQAGGHGYLGLGNLATVPGGISDAALDASVSRYIHDCVSFALMQPASTLTPDELLRNSTDFMASLEKAQHPAITTVMYSQQVPQGTSCSCTDAFTNIKAGLQGNLLEGNLTAVCSAMGYASDDPSAIVQCRTVLTNVLQGADLSHASIDQFIRQAYLARKLDQAFRSGDSLPVGNFQALIKASGAMQAANEWLPVLKAALTAVTVGLLPFLALLVPTPLVGKAGGLILGLFVWLTAWGVTDAVVHQFATNYTLQVFELVRQQKLGMDALYLLPDQTVKALAMFGTLRLSGMMLATILTGSLIRFGGHALAAMAGSLSGTIATSGMAAGQSTEDPRSRAEALQATSHALPTQAWGSAHRFEERAVAARGNLERQTGHGFGLATEGFSQGVRMAQQELGVSDAFAQGGDTRDSAALGTSLNRAPTGTYQTSSGQSWVRFESSSGAITKLESGAQRLTMTGNTLTAAEGMSFGVGVEEQYRQGLSQTRSALTAEAVQYDTSTGQSLLASIGNSRWQQAMQSINHTDGISRSSQQELSQGVTRSLSQLAGHATSIKDESGQTVSKGSFMQVVAGGHGGIAAGQGVQIGVDGQTGYRVTKQQSDGTIKSYTVEIANRSSVERSVGEQWRQTTARLMSDTSSKTTTEAVQTLLSATNTQTTTEQATRSWRELASFERRVSTEEAELMRSGGSYDAALIRWYGDHQYPDTPAKERYAEAASDLQQMVLQGDQTGIRGITKQFIAEKKGGLKNE